MEKRIIFQNETGGVSVIVPFLGGGLTVAQIAAKDVPAGAAFKIVDAADIPDDRSQRAAWAVDLADLTDGVGADYGAGSANAVVEWGDDGQPVTQEFSA
jgi:hypothetical protein